MLISTHLPPCEPALGTKGPCEIWSCYDVTIVEVPGKARHRKVPSYRGDQIVPTLPKPDLQTALRINPLGKLDLDYFRSLEAR